MENLEAKARRFLRVVILLNWYVKIPYQKLDQNPLTTKPLVQKQPLSAVVLLGKIMIKEVFNKGNFLIIEKGVNGQHISHVLHYCSAFIQNDNDYKNTTKLNKS